MLNRSLLMAHTRRLVPPRQSRTEALGYLVLGLGILLGTALLSHGSTPAANLAGPWGHHIASAFLQQLGLVAALWPAALSALGTAMALGFLRGPSLRRLVGFGLVNLAGTALCHIYRPHSGLAAFDRGLLGGSLGMTLGDPLVATLSYVGAMIVVVSTLAAGLALTGNLTLSDIGPAILDGIAAGRRMVMVSVNWVIRLFTLDSSTFRPQGPNVWMLPSPQEQRRGLALRPAASGSSGSSGTSPGHHRTLDTTAMVTGGGAKGPAAAAAALGASPENAAVGLSLAFQYDGATVERPSDRIFKRTSLAPKPNAKVLESLARDLTAQLGQFQVEGKVRAITEGPVVTTFEFEPAPGTKISKISNLSEDLARLLKAQSLRILAPIPGKNTIGFEVPNAEARMIGFGNLIDHKKFRSQSVELPIAMGVDIFGKPVVEDLASMPHLLVAGSTGSGKSVFINSLISSLALRHSPKDLRFIMMDPKMVELAAYNELPHMATPVVTDPAGEGKAILEAVVVEMESRYERLRQLGVRNIAGYNDTIRQKRKSDFKSFTGKWQTMPYIVLVIDELADMMMVLGKEAEIPITRIAQKARAAGIHMVIATQRPSAEVVTGLIKANFPTRVAFRVLSGVDSRTILDQSGAETLLGRGDMLYLSPRGMTRLHGAFLSDGEVQGLVKSFGRRGR